MAIANDSNVILSTFALGSCVGVVIVDPLNRVGGLLHVMLPVSSVAAQKAKLQPYLFADTGVEKFTSMLVSMDADLSRCACVIAGGASVMTAGDAFKIGKQNAEAVTAKLSSCGIAICKSFLGGFTNRSLHLNLAECSLKVVMPNEQTEFLLT